MEGVPEQIRDAYAKLMQERDKVSPSPTLRAKVVWDILQAESPKPIVWDLVCFSLEILTISSESYPYIIPAVKVLNQAIYGAHYNTEEPFPSFINVDGTRKERKVESTPI